MKLLNVLVLMGLLFTQLTICRSQDSDQSPFIFTSYGGLFFPSNVEFEKIYQSHSDLIWGVGVALPTEALTFVTADVAFFRSEGYYDRLNDSAATLEQRFIHVGVLHKETIGRRFFIRLSGGFNHVNVKQKTSGPRSAEQTIEPDKKIGYFGGIGVERLLEEGRVSFFGDVVYDYCRLHAKELSGDFGGIRLVVGVHFFLF